MSEQPFSPTKETGHCWSDISLWLQVTGYHDADFRKSKLKREKEKEALEQEAARIQGLLEKLRRDDLALPRSSMPSTIENPKKPSTVPASNEVTVRQKTPEGQPATLKRARSPEPATLEKSARYDGESTTHSVQSTKEAQDGTATRTDELRDASSERRQKPYSLGIEPAAVVPPPNMNSTSGPTSSKAGYGRLHSSSGNDWSSSASYGRLPQQYKRSASLNLQEGGVRYFMMKSWNFRNVGEAMRLELWATQVKNEQLLTEAFETSRLIILLFSVNGSQHFQGAAVMVSRPDRTLRKPSFLSGLNWETSPPFRLQWLATMPVHFRSVGHLNNELKLDDRGQPSPVLIGRDGQEISAEAARGVVEILQNKEVEQSKCGLQLFPTNSLPSQSIGGRRSRWDQAEACSANSRRY